MDTSRHLHVVWKVHVIKNSSAVPTCVEVVVEMAALCPQGCCLLLLCGVRRGVVSVLWGCSCRLDGVRGSVGGMLCPGHLVGTRRWRVVLS